MITRRSIVFLMTAMTALARLEPASVPVAATDRFRETLLAATEVVIYEGLPHQMWQPAELAVELKRKDVTKIWKFPFYTPAIKASNVPELKRLLGTAGSIQPYRGPKACGGYHPDYCVSWAHQGVTFHAMVCFGCHEIAFFDGTNSLRYDVADSLEDPLQAALKRYASKRPVRNG